MLAKPELGIPTLLSPLDPDGWYRYRNRDDLMRSGLLVHLDEITHDVLRLRVPPQIIASSQDDDMGRLTTEDVPSKAHHHFSRQLAADPANGDLYRGSDHLLKERPIGRLTTGRIVTGRRLKSCGKTVAKTHHERIIRRDAHCQMFLTTIYPRHPPPTCARATLQMVFLCISVNGGRSNLRISSEDPTPKSTDFLDERGLAR